VFGTRRPDASVRAWVRRYGRPVTTNGIHALRACQAGTRRFLRRFLPRPRMPRLRLLARPVLRLPRTARRTAVLPRPGPVSLPAQACAP
jgi:hypothetical protein